MGDLTYARGDETCNDGVAPGQRGVLKCGKLSFPTVERGGGYKWIRPGSYECEFGYWTIAKTLKGETKIYKRQAIRVLGVYKNRVYFHPANKPSQLKGCVAPGLTKNKLGVSSSRAAMDKIFAELGGFETGKKLTLVVTGQMIAKQGHCNPGEDGDLPFTPFTPEFLV